jgi:hypothetical protein
MSGILRYAGLFLILASFNTVAIAALGLWGVIPAVGLVFGIPLYRYSE